MTEEQPRDKRIFPRLDARCPVLYQPDGQQSWKVGKMQNLSATGLQLICNDNLQPFTLVHIHVKPGTRKDIPEIRASGEVVSCEALQQGYMVSCKLTRIEPD